MQRVNVGAPRAAADVDTADVVIGHREAGGRIDGIAGHGLSPFEREVRPTDHRRGGGH